MSIATYTRPAKCKDCDFCKSLYEDDQYRLQICDASRRTKFLKSKNVLINRQHIKIALNGW